ncbi:hypothetical protein ABZW47_16390 [Streptomyces sp. NPDC004549]|uniref:hypothetical protein n=1 Tax=Streptomyces sp. NPDC004549 TaxID=3154283 RepID=UPI0033B08DAE
MDEISLSARERRVLAELEETLRHDRAAVRLRRATRLLRLRVPAAAAAGLSAVSFTLLGLAVALTSPALCCAFGAVWLTTLIVLARLTFRRSRDWVRKPCD